ncbi:glycoside hydrolase family 88/105 protein [Dysgonomonas macrotermitis]|uniref:Unsaturated rhamnogalacturonyl hydrolase n=1 Tax=Dysgonomonas macrotermitis TaxID=1346286 RepID=A0A1M4VZ77_9BACT|nr:glycoside hydrolase family 88 protein [Dysgonomonas macrotermitis]SHE74257.1 unsaturated rhamnogalacturonyl hydrolase [Dysgonomonas macrotermitis]
MKKYIKFSLIGCFGILLFLSACKQEQKKTEETKEDDRWSVRMAQSEMKRFPEAWMIEKAKSPRWGYTHGCVAKAMLDMFDYTQDSVYFNYAKGYADTLITQDGQIKTYNMAKFNIDNINPGKILFRLYKSTGDQRYKTAIDTLVAQMNIHPRTKEGGFWHKQIYQHQMWLDGIYMASPFLAEYAKDFNKPEVFDDVVKQIKLMDKNTYDAESGLFYHGWDESKEQKWADKTTGHSPNFWTRSVGWYAMALVDVLDYLPQEHESRKDILEIIDRVAKGTVKWQDKKTGVWYQVTNMGDKEGNYLESSGSSMLVYFLYKAMNKGYINKEYKAAADKGFDGLVKEFIKKEADGTYTITNCCAVAGLGGDKKYRDGSFEYYISEPIIENDPKSVPTFIWAAMEHEKAN